MADFDIQAPRESYFDVLNEALGMSVVTIKSELEKLRNLSDDPEENVFTAGMQIRAAALNEALDRKMEQTAPKIEGDQGSGKLKQTEVAGAAPVFHPQK